MADHVVVVTGVTGSIGGATARALARAGADLVLVARDAARLGALADELRRAGGGGAVDVQPIDLARPASVRDGARAILARHPRVRALVNNAAVFKKSRVELPGGLETMFAVNHLGTFLLTRELLSGLRAAGAGAASPARVVTVTAPSAEPLDFGDLQSTRGFSALKVFGRSKTANLLFVYTLARREAANGVASFGFFPGFVRSDLMSDSPVLGFFSKLFSRSPERAGAALADAAIGAQWNDRRELFLKVGKPVEPPPYAHDTAVQDQLWTASERLLAG